MELRLGFHSAAFFVHLSSLCEAILMASGHFSCLRVAIQQLMLHVRVFLQLLCGRCDENDPVLFFIVGTAHVVVCVAFNLYTTVLVVLHASYFSIF